MRDAATVSIAEDAWPTVRIGNLKFRTTMVCDRCVMTTIDPITLAGGKEPIRTLARYRRWDRKTWFGTRLVPLVTGTISLGDAVEPESAHDRVRPRSVTTLMT